MVREKDYTISEWSGKTQHNCAYCPFDTLRGIDVLEKHLYKNHRELMPVDPVRPVKAVLFAADGQQVTHITQPTTTSPSTSTSQPQSQTKEQETK